MGGFSYRYRLSGEAPTIQKLVFRDTETLTSGDLVNLEAGQVDLAATADTNIQGLALETRAGVSAVTKIEVLTDSDAVFGVVDGNARKKGATLDIAGATGAQGVAASANRELVVVADSTASQETLVRINVGKHADSKAQ